MIIKEEYISSNSENPLWKLYSNEDFYLLKNEILYDEAIENQEADLSGYIETSIPIPEKTINANDFYNTIIGKRRITISQLNNGLLKLKDILREIPSEDAYRIKFLCPEWLYNTSYVIGDKVYYNNKLYEVITDTNGQLTPEEDNAFLEIRPPQDIIEEWDNSYSHNYRRGDKVKIGTHIYTSLIENNIWSPTEFPAAWQLEGSQD